MAAYREPLKCECTKCGKFGKNSTKLKSLQKKDDDSEEIKEYQKKPFVGKCFHIRQKGKKDLNVKRKKGQEDQKVCGWNR